MQTRTDSSSAYDDPALFQAALDRFQQDAETAVNQAHAGRLAHIQAIRDPIERMRALLDYHENPGKHPTRPRPTRPQQRVRKGRSTTRENKRRRIRRTVRTLRLASRKGHASRTSSFARRLSLLGDHRRAAVLT